MSKSYFEKFNIEGFEEGVSFQELPAINSYYERIRDIYIESGVKTVTLDIPMLPLNKNLIFELRGIFRQFPDVETLIIGSSVYAINISNFMFPNVKRIISKTPRFVNNHSVLIMSSYRTELLNTFCKQPGERINIFEVDAISNYAFEGCKSTEIIFNKNNFKQNYNKIQENAIKGYIDDIRLNKSNIAELCGTIFRIGDVSENVDIMDSRDKPEKNFIHSLSFENIKKLTIHNSDLLSQLRSLPPILEIQETDYPLSNKLSMAIANSDDGNLKDVVIKNQFYKTINGVTYSKDGLTLVFCSPSKKGTFKIPDNVKHIERFAFNNSHLETIEIPSGIQTIGSHAFSSCSELKHLKFEEGIKIIGSPGNGSIISDCGNLDIIEIPESVVYIKDDALSLYYGTIILHEGIQAIGKNALPHVDNKTLDLPETLVDVGDLNFLNTMTFNMKSLINELVPYIIDYGDNLSNTDIINNGTVVTLNIDKKPFYLPKYLCGNSVDVAYEAEKYIYSDHPEKLLCLYERISIAAIKQKTAIQLYELTKSDDIKTYLRRSGNSIVKNLVDKNDTDSMIKLLSFNILTKTALKKALDAAQKNNMAEVAAYILKSMDESDNTKSGFRL